MEETGGDETTAMQIRIPAFLFSIKISFGIPAAEGGRRRLGGGREGIDSSQSPRSIKQLRANMRREIGSGGGGVRNKGWKKRRLMTRASFIRDDRPLSRNLWWEGKGDVFRKRHQVSTMGGIGGDPREGDPTDGSQRKRRQHGVSARSPMHAADGGNPVNDEQSRSSDPSSRSSSLLSFDLRSIRS